MKKRYRNPPILEAVCEIHFDLPAPLTRDQIAVMEAVWQPSLPDVRINEEKGLEVTIGLNGVQTKEQPGGHRLVARAADSSRIAQLGGHFLAVNQLKPYSGWAEGFRAHIKERLEEVQAHLPVQRVKQINLRYIDRLDFPETPLTWSEWFDFTLPVPSIIPSVGGTLQFHFEQNLPEGLGLVLHLVSIPSADEDNTSVILDCTIAWRGSASLDECPTLLERVHEPHPQIFNDFLTSRSKELFGAYNV
ncbi:MAG TPA: TIGR04255 family protein [Chthoniobacteraceae bacterium]|nr:TIGR04255 family protein [Chthoniobacteraceae bacterium]